MDQTKQTERGYKVLLIELRRLRGDTGSNAFRRAQILKDVLADREFWEDNPGLDDASRREMLEDYTSDLCIGVFELVRMIELFPDRSRWETTPLDRLFKECIAEDNKRKTHGPRARSKDEIQDALRKKVVELEKLLAEKDAKIRQLERRLKAIERAAHKAAVA